MPEERRAGRRFLCAVFILILASLFALPAHAFVIAQDELYGSSTDLGLDVRSFSFLFTGPLLDKPYNLTNEDPSSMNLTNTRLYFDVEEPWGKVVVHNQLTNQLMSSAFIGFLNIGQAPTPARWLPLNWTLVNRDNFIMYDTFDWAYVSLVEGPATVTVGRQPVTFGRGTLWRPMDVIDPFSLTAVDTEYKPGVDAVRLDLTPSQSTNLTLLAAAGDWNGALSVTGSSFAVRATHGWSVSGRGGITGGEIGFLGGLIHSDGVLGLDGLLSTTKLDVYAEATLTIPARYGLTPRPPQTGDGVIEGIAGVKLKPADKLTVVPEVWYNGFGAAVPADYLRVAVSDRMASGEIYTMGRVYLAETTLWEPYPLLNVSLAVLVNPQDPSGLFVPALKYSVANSVELSAGAYLPAGPLPSATPPVTSLSSLVPKSEFGLYPDFFFMELRIFL